MPHGRQPHHSTNWGGARPGAGRPVGRSRSINRPKLILPETVVDVTPQPGFVKPLDYLWARMNDNRLPGSYRDSLAKVLLPFFHARVTMSAALSRLFDKQVKRLSDDEIDQHLAELGYVRVPVSPSTTTIQ